MLGACGISRNLIYDMERRNITPSTETMLKIANYLDCTVDYLAGRTSYLSTALPAQGLPEDAIAIVNDYLTLNAEGKAWIRKCVDVALQLNDPHRHETE